MGILKKYLNIKKESEKEREWEKRICNDDKKKGMGNMKKIER